MSEVDRVAASLLGETPIAVLPVLGGRNNRLFRVCSSRGHYAMKLYDPGDGTGWECFARETRALAFLADTVLADCVPAVLAADPAECAALFEWVTGEVPAPRRAGEIAQLQHVVQSLLMISRGPVAAAFPPALDACGTPAELVRQIEARRARLGELAVDPGLTLWLGRFDALWHRVRTPLLAPQDPARLVLSPADFGFHNSLRRPDGRLVFVDFEYFGWDDPVRLVADLLWHPGMAITPAEAGSIYTTAQAAFGACDGGFAQRFARAWPAIGLRWSLNLLNEFLPERRRRGQRADPVVAKRRQLDKATAWIGRVEDCLQDVAA